VCIDNRSGYVLDGSSSAAPGGGWVLLQLVDGGIFSLGGWHVRSSCSAEGGRGQLRKAVGI